jgi:hypothetical protein
MQAEKIARVGVVPESSRRPQDQRFCEFSPSEDRWCCSVCVSLSWGASPRWLRSDLTRARARHFRRPFRKKITLMFCWKNEQWRDTAMRQRNLPKIPIMRNRSRGLSTIVRGVGSGAESPTLWAFHSGRRGGSYKISSEEMPGASNCGSP